VTVSESVLKSSGTGVTDRNGNEPGELVSASICFGESLKTFADSALDGDGEASPPLLLILRFSFPAPFAATDEEPLGRDSCRAVFPLVSGPSRPLRSCVAPCSAIGDKAGVASCSFDNEPFNPSIPSPSLCASLIVKYRVTRDLRHIVPGCRSDFCACKLKLSIETKNRVPCSG